MPAGLRLPQVTLPFYRLIYSPILTSVPRAKREPERSPPGITVDVWDTKTGFCNNITDIDGDDPANIVLSGTTGMIAVSSIGGGIHVYDIETGERLREGKHSPLHKNQLGAQWAHDGSFRFAASSQSDEQVTIDICELARAPGPSLRVVASFPVGPRGGQFSFSPTSYHASFVTGTEVVILDIKNQTEALSLTEEISPLYIPPGCFSHDGSIFACGTVENEVYVWKKSPDGYVSKGSLKPLLPFMGFAISPIATSILSWGPEGLELFGLDDFASGTHMGPVRQEDCVAVRRAVAGPGIPYSYLRFPHAHDQ